MTFISRVNVFLESVSAVLFDETVNLISMLFESGGAVFQLMGWAIDYEFGYSSEGFGFLFIC